jgi:hypothetical protein
MLCKHVPCNTLAHSTNEDLLSIKRKGDPEVLYPLFFRAESSLIQSKSPRISISVNVSKVVIKMAEER